MRSSALVLAAGLVLAGCSRHKSGHSLYGNNCGICHHGGQGMAGSVPPLVGRIDRIAATPEGQAYLASVLMNGLSGTIHANGMTFDAEMPPFRYLKDEEVAAILTWLASEGGTHPAPVISPAVIAKARARRVGAGDVSIMRKVLDRTHPLP